MGTFPHTPVDSKKPGYALRLVRGRGAATRLDWYALRPIKLTDGPLTQRVQASGHFTMKTISRADVAWYIVSLAEDPRPGQLRTPIITSAAKRSAPGHPGTENLAAQQTP